MTDTIQPTRSADSPAFWSGIAAWVFILSVAVASLWFFYTQGLTNVYGDAKAHMEGARRIVDSLTPGYDEIGTVWLPLPHLLAAPLATNDFLWRTGLAGSLVSTAAFVAAAWFLFRLAWMMNGNSAAGLLGLAGFVLSPNLLYTASTPLTEPLALLWAVLLVYGLFRYQQTGQLRALIGSALAASLGTLTRYECWSFLPFAALFVFAARGGPWEVRLRRTVLFAAISGLGPALWLLHNAYRFGNPLEFFDGPFSAKAIYAHQIATTAFRFPTDGSLLNSVRYYVEDLKLVLGAWPLALAVLGLVAWATDRTQRARRAVVLLFLVPFPFHVYSLAHAAVPLYVPTLFPFTYYNLRLGLEMLPAVALLPTLLLATRLPSRVRQAVLALLIGLVVFQAGSGFARGAAELPVAKEGVLNNPCRSKKQQAVIRFLRAHYDGQMLLAAAGRWPCVMPELGIPFRRILSDANRKYWARIRFAVPREAKWIIRGNGDAVDEIMRAFPHSFEEYELVHAESFPGEGSVSFYRRGR